VIDAIAFKFQSGTPWVHLPEKYGSWRGVYNRLRVWAIDGTWERVFTALMARIDVDEDLNRRGPGARSTALRGVPGSGGDGRRGAGCPVQSDHAGARAATPTGCRGMTSRPPDASNMRGAHPANHQRNTPDTR
jgi:transposase